MKKIPLAPLVRRRCQPIRVSLGHQRLCQAPAGPARLADDSTVAHGKRIDYAAARRKGERPFCCAPVKIGDSCAPAACRRKASIVRQPTGRLLYATRAARALRGDVRYDCVRPDVASVVDLRV